MHNQLTSLSDTTRTRLRKTLDRLEGDLERLPKQLPENESADPRKTLLADFHDLVEQLALGPEPELRECPVCKHLGMRAATLCGYCWTKLAPLPERGVHH